MSQNIKFRVPDNYGTVNVYVSLTNPDDLKMIIDPEEIVIKTTKPITLVIKDYDNSIERSFEPSTKKGFTRLDMAKAAYKLFNIMYKRDNWGDHALLYQIVYESGAYVFWLN